MAISREMTLLIALLVVIVLLLTAIQLFKKNVVEADASNFVIEDLTSKYPDSDISIMTITAKENPNGEKYFEVKAKLTEQPLSPCPERSHIFYNYPVQNFVAQPTEAITRNCSVCNDGICTIAFPEEAIIASHTFEGTEFVHTYVTYFSDIKSYLSQENNSWVVVWDAPEATYYYKVTLEVDGTVTSVDRLEKA